MANIEKVRVRITRDCWPKFGGFRLRAGQVLELDAPAIKQLPSDAYVVLRDKQAASPADKQARPAKTKR